MPQAGPWITKNPNANWIRGPFFVPDHCAIVGFHVFEQAGHGVIDLQALYRNLRNGMGGELGRMTDNRNENWDRYRGDCAAGFAMTGLKVREQAGYGVIDLDARYRSLSHCDQSCESGWYCGNPNATHEYDWIETPLDHFIIGLEAAEQAGFGIIDIRFHFEHRCALLA